MLKMLRLLMLGWLVLVWCGSAQAQQFNNDGRFYQVRQVTNGSGQNVSQVFVLDRWTSTYSAIPVGATTAGGAVLNAMGLNSVDRYLYALQSGTNKIFRITTAGPTALGTVTGLPSATYNAGAMDSAGNYYVLSSTASTLYRINNVSGASGDGTNPVTGVTVTAIPLTAVVNPGDMAIDPSNGRLSGLTLDATPRLFSIDITSGAGTAPVQFTTISGTTFNTFGSAFFDISGRFYAYSNNGAFFTFNLATAAATQLSTAPTASQSDGASNAFFNVPLSVTKSVTNITKPNATTYDITFAATITNTSATDTATNVQLTDNLDLTFNTGTPTLSITATPVVTAGIALSTNGAFNGRATGDTRLLIGNQPLGAGANTTVSFTVRAVYPNAASVPTQTSNTVYGSSTSTVNPSGYNSGFTFPNNVPVPPPDLIGVATSNPAPINFRTIAGRVFEDVDYGGGTGRAFGTAGTAGVPAGTRVELYFVAGTTATFAQATTTDATGQYQFTNVPTGDYLVRVVNGGINGVKSTRATTGQAGTILPVQTFRTTGAVADGTQIGGSNPSTSDAPDGATGTTINTTSGALSGNGAPAGSVAQSIGLASTTNSNVTRADFGFNFDTVVNTNSSG